MRTMVLPVALLAGLLGTGGCSFMLVEGPPPNHEKLNYFDCTTQSWWPAEDISAGVLFGSTLVAGIAATVKGSVGQGTSSSALSPTKVALRPHQA